MRKTRLEKMVLGVLLNGVPIASRPYRRMAKELGVSEEDFLKTAQDLCRRGVVRRFGAAIRHGRAGVAANAMAAWRVEDRLADSTGELFAALPQVSHCYLRKPSAGWPYNLYTMVHGPDRKTLVNLVREMAARSGVSDYCILFSKRELKKTSMKYP
jgi:DNA-binding Lrp family transcriptional regulator